MYSSPATPHGETVRVADPLLPEIDAVIVAGWLDELFFPFTVVVATELSPADVTLDVGDTVAAPVALHVTVRPQRGRPLASLTTAFAVVVAFDLIALDPSVTATLATWPFESVIVIGCEVTPSLVAVIVALSARPPVTCTLDPLVAERLTMFGSLVCQAIPRPVRTFPFASFVVATSVVVAFCEMDVAPAAIEIVVTGSRETLN
jgi:hypothetical protein